MKSYITKYNVYEDPYTSSLDLIHLGCLQEKEAAKEELFITKNKKEAAKEELFITKNEKEAAKEELFTTKNLVSKVENQLQDAERTHAPCAGRVADLE
ncbi:hypothetical protein T484DRAFT_1819752 [Baffinella frigidus]|nr:hypothetical protein T484DRAFT_1819752 [Cryptophyta sp. CCMP2293]